MHTAGSSCALELNIGAKQPETAGPIFSQPWWLDAVAPGSWTEAIVKRDNLVLARMPYVFSEKAGAIHIRMPALTQTLGPSLAYTSPKYAHRLSEEKELLTQLIDQLPKFQSFDQKFHHSVTNWLPFYWRGFSQTTRYTYVLEELDKVDALWDGLRSNIRRSIRKAQKLVAVRDDGDVGSFLDLNERVFRRQGLKLPYSREFVERIDAACAERNCRKIFFAEDVNGQQHAALYLVWNGDTAYYLMGGSHADLRESGASSLLMWEAIKFASTVSKTFDFEGSMIEPIERFFRGFGARQIPYFRIAKVNPTALSPSARMRAALKILRG